MELSVLKKVSNSLFRIFEMIVSRLDGVSSPNPLEPDSTDHPRAIAHDNVKECSYLFRAISNILPALSHAGWSTLTAHSVEVLEKNQNPSADGKGIFRFIYLLPRLTFYVI